MEGKSGSLHLYISVWCTDNELVGKDIGDMLGKHENRYQEIENQQDTVDLKLENGVEGIKALPEPKLMWQVTQDHFLVLTGILVLQ